MDEFPKQYNPKETEERWYRYWEENNLFAARSRPARKPFCIVIPPPNVTGILHMGHALNNTYQDILIRLKRMQGYESLWMPGTDHAGIATQNVVERQIAKEGLKRQDLGREKFLERVWQWKEQYGSTIIAQLKKLGASCDWQRLRFTMDEGYSEAVKEVFISLYEKGLIYQGNYIINWCPRCQTALSDEEAPHIDQEGHLYYIKYPFKSVAGHQSVTSKKKTGDRRQVTGDYIVVATTRPETMLGDTAVAVNPRDSRYKKLIGMTLVLPLVGRQIKVIADSAVDMKFGTGAVKVTPAHDPQDFITGRRHRLESILVMNSDATMNQQAGAYQGMDRFAARQAIVEDLKKQGLLLKVRPHKFAAGHCYRCHTMIEPYLSKQWFVKMKPLAQPAIQVVKKRQISFYPCRWKRIYLNWMENIQDWCISRQIWWGHRIPVYYCRKCQETGTQKPETRDQKPGKEKGIIVSREKPEKCPVCGSTDIYQEEDVLDTWFSSWLWPFATFGWPGTGYKPQAASNRQKNLQPEACSLEPDDLDYFYPTSVLVTAPEILFFWVARMIMAGLEFRKAIPFRYVFIHGTVRDIAGKKMSKSLGNIIDPVEIIDTYGCDALRFSLVSITAAGQDIFLSKEKFEHGRNFANKLWNASRYLLLNLQERPPQEGTQINYKDLDLAERWMLSVLQRVVDRVTRALEGYRFNEAANCLYEFFWHEFCDWYVEISKPCISCCSSETSPKAGQVLGILREVLEVFLRLAHPCMPFITEEIWQKLPHTGKSIMEQPWPEYNPHLIDKDAEVKMGLLKDVVTAIRNLKTEADVPVHTPVAVTLQSQEVSSYKLLLEKGDLIRGLAWLGDLKVTEHYQRLSSCLAALAGDIHIYVALGESIDMSSYLKRLQENIQRLSVGLQDKEKRLKNKDFLKKAPAQVITQEREKAAEYKKAIERQKGLLRQLAPEIVV